MKAEDKDRALIAVRELCFNYFEHKRSSFGVLNDVSFDIFQGEFISFLGPSGSGKTSLLRLIAGLESPSSGIIEKSKDALEIGMVFQDLALFPHMSVARNIGYALRHLSRSDRRERVNEMLSLVGLEHKRGSFPHELSGGQKQRLALARALSHQPDLILLDEPFAAQDIGLRAQMRDDVMHILRKAGVAALLVTHDPEEAMQFADRIAVMNDGQIQQIGVPHEVYNQPINAFVASFFGQVNTFEGMVSSGIIQTPIGPIKTPDFDDDTKVKIIVRPEAIKLSSHDPEIDHRDPNHIHSHCYVSEQKFLGRSTLVHMDTVDIDDTGEEPVHLHARVPGLFFNQDHTVQDIYLDHSQIFVFKDECLQAA